MKILIVNTYDIHGGAARAAYRLHTALQSIGIESKMLVQFKDGCDDAVLGPETKIQKAMGVLRRFLCNLPVKAYKRRNGTTFSLASIPHLSLASKINSADADLVHLHWLADGMMSIEDFGRIRKPIVWTLHDMWAFTGGCHYDGGCGKYVYACGACPVLCSLKKADLSSRVFRRKVRTFSGLEEMTVVGVSRWLANIAQTSALLKNRPIINLPNPIDTQTFRPYEKAAAKSMISLPRDKKVILFGAMNATSDRRKGFSLLSQALYQMQSKDVELAVFGTRRPQDEPDFGFPTHYLGRIYDDYFLPIVYSAADVLVVPSLQENLSNVVMEGLACGTPVVGFNVGGNPDMIDHGANGYLAEPNHQNDLARGIDWVLCHLAPHELSQRARRKALDNFDAKRVAQNYLGLYKAVLKGKLKSLVTSSM